MTDPIPGVQNSIVVGLDADFCFMNFADPDHPPIRLELDLKTRCILSFRLSDALLAAGWRFQKKPIEIRNDYGVNFSSYIWREHIIDGQKVPYCRFDIIYEDARLGEYEYSLFMMDKHGQAIDLDPKIENGAGWTDGD